MCEGSHVYALKSPLHIVVLVLNIFLPGFGTMLSAFACMHAEREEKKSCFCATFSDGLIQFYLSPVLFGWVWSIVFGVALYRKGRDHRRLMASRPAR